jgi:hypothetical protein
MMYANAWQSARIAPHARCPPAPGQRDCPARLWQCPRDATACDSAPGIPARPGKDLSAHLYAARHGSLPVPVQARRGATATLGIICPSPPGPQNGRLFSGIHCA